MYLMLSIVTVFCIETYGLSPVKNSLEPGNCSEVQVDRLTPPQNVDGRFVFLTAK